MTLVDYGAIVFVCGFLLWGVFGTIVIYHEHLSNRTNDMKNSCRTLAGIMITTAMMAFALGVRWHHVYSDALHQAEKVREVEPADQMAILASHTVVTPAGNVIQVGGDWYGVRAGTTGQRQRFGGDRSIGSGGGLGGRRTEGWAGDTGLHSIRFGLLPGSGWPSPAEQQRDSF